MPHQAAFTRCKNPDRQIHHPFRAERAINHYLKPTINLFFRLISTLSHQKSDNTNQRRETGELSMKTLSIEELQRTLAALDARDQLSESVKAEINKITSGDINPMDILQKAGLALATNSLSPATFGLPENLFEQLEQLDKINSVASAKLRAYTIAQLNELQSIEDAEVVSHA